MAKQRIINTKFWSDGYISDLDPIEKLLFLYVLTNQYTNILGIYELPLRNIAFDTGIDKEMVEKIFGRFSEDKKLYYIDGWICIKNFTKHQSNSPLIITGMKRELDLIPENIIKSIEGIDRICIGYVYDKLRLELKLKLKLKFNKKEAELARLLFDLIKKNTPTFREPDLDKWAEHIRLMAEQDNRTYEQIKLVIEWSQKNDFWQANILSTSKLRKQFDTLVAQIKRDTKSKNQWHII